MKLNGVIQRKLALLDQEVSWLESTPAALSEEAFLADRLYQKGAERGLQLAVEIVIDIAERLVSLQGAGPVSSGGEALKRLEGLGVIKEAATYQQMVRFRNLIVHQYETIDPKFVFAILKEHLGDFRRFRGEIDHFCQ